MGDIMTWIWLSIAFLFLILEYINKNCVNIWFALSSFVCFLINFITNDFIFQFILFVLLGFITMVILRQITVIKVNDYFDRKTINKKGIVIKDIYKNKYGKIKIGKRKYLACANKKIKSGKLVIVLKRNQNLLVVKEDK